MSPQGLSLNLSLISLSLSFKENKEKGNLKSDLTKANTKNKKASKLNSNQIWEIWLKVYSPPLKIIMIQIQTYQYWYVSKVPI